jgi:hypothetical protein
MLTCSGWRVEGRSEEFQARIRGLLIHKTKTSKTAFFVILPQQYDTFDTTLYGDRTNKNRKLVKVRDNHAKGLEKEII